MHQYDIFTRTFAVDMKVKKKNNRQKKGNTKKAKTSSSTSVQFKFDF